MGYLHYSFVWQRGRRSYSSQSVTKIRWSSPGWRKISKRSYQPPWKKVPLSRSPLITSGKNGTSIMQMECYPIFPLLDRTGTSLPWASLKRISSPQDWTLSSALPPWEGHLSQPFGSGPNSMGYLTTRSCSGGGSSPRRSMSWDMPWVSPTASILAVSWTSPTGSAIRTGKVRSSVTGAGEGLGRVGKGRGNGFFWREIWKNLISERRFGLL